VKIIRWVWAGVLGAFLFAQNLAKGREDILPQDHPAEHGVSVMSGEIAQAPAVAVLPVGGPQPMGAPMFQDPRWHLFPPLTPGSPPLR
jgi:hypothetical protein